MKAFRNHKGLTATIAVLLVIAVGAAVYAVAGRNSSPSSSGSNNTKAAAHHPIIKNPSEVKTGTKVPSTVTSTSSTPPSNATGGPAPKAVKSN